MATPSAADPMSPYVPVTTNDLAESLVEVVMQWYRGNRNVLSAGQQSAAITAITGILNGTLKV